MSTFVFWDIEDCPIPEELIKDPYLISDNIKLALLNEGDYDKPTICGYVKKHKSTTDEFLQRYKDAGIFIFDVPGDKDERLHKMLMHILFRVANRYISTNVMVISRNLSEATIYVINSLMSRGINVYLAQPGHKAVLSHDARLKWCFKCLLYGGKPLDQCGGSSQCVDNAVEAKQRKKLRSVIVSSSSNPKSTENKDSEILIHKRRKLTRC